jgi:uncharacterized protein (TIGR02996 family)
MSHAAFLAAVRADPDDDTTRLVFADWYEENGQPERAEFIRLACRLTRLPLAAAEYPDVQRRCLDLYVEHYERWVGEWPAELEWSFDRGLVTGVCGPLAAVAECWKGLFERHPIHRVRISDDVSASVTRAATELAWLPQVDDLRVYWSEPTHQLFDAFDPSLLRFRRLWIDGDPGPRQVRKLFDGPTRERIESFRYINCRYITDANRDRRAAHRAAFHDMLLRLNAAPLRELGVLISGTPFGPDDLRNILTRDFARRLEYLEVSAAEPTKAFGELLARTDRLPNLRRLALGIDRSNRLHELDAILANPHLPGLTRLATEWSTVSDRVIAESAFLPRASELQLWRPIADRAAQPAVPLADTPAVPEALDVNLDWDHRRSVGAWVSAPWASSVRHLRLRGVMECVLSFATTLAASRGFPNLRRLSLVLESTAAPAEVPKFVAAVRASAWLRDAQVTCHSNAFGDHAAGPAGTVPAMAPENPGDLAWYACPQVVGRYRAFHVLPAE